MGARTSHAASGTELRSPFHLARAHIDCAKNRKEVAMKKLLNVLCAAGFLACTGGLTIATTHAAADQRLEAGQSADNWQIRRLMEPTEAERAREADGEIVIYDGLTDQQVEEAMTKHFDRIKNMMFVGTLVTDDEGEPFFDPVGGMFAMEDGGC
jgi:hypothetical protein